MKTDVGRVLRTIRGRIQHEVNSEKERESKQNPQHAKLTRGTILGLERAWKIVNEAILDAERA